MCFEEFLNQLNFLYKYRMIIYEYLMTQKKSTGRKCPVIISSKYECHILTRLIKITYRICKL
jgi:hypothetical protein